MQSCDELEPEVIGMDPLILLFPDLREKLTLKLTVECELVLEKMRQIQSKLESIYEKFEKSFGVIEGLYFECCREEEGLELVTCATATRPSYTFMLNGLKDVADAFYAEINRQSVVCEQLCKGEPGRVLDVLQKLLPLKREGVSKCKILSFYVQFFLQETDS